MPVQVIRCQVEPRRGLGTERRRPCQPEARALHDERLDVEVDRIDQWRLGVPGVDRADTTGAQHRDGQQRGGGLAVGPGDGEDRAGPAVAVLLPAVRELDLRDEFDAVATGGVDHRMGLGHPRCGAHEITRPDEPVEIGGRGCREQFDAEVVCQLAPGVVDVVVDHDDVDVARLERPDGRRTGDGEPVHERGHGVPAATFVKSAMKMPSATATQMAEISQKRMITVVSGQPTSSKW